LGFIFKPQFAPTETSKEITAPKPAKPQQTLTTILTWLAIWILPLMAISYALPEPIWAQISLFFSKLAVVTFGGAYAVLAYMAQDVVTHYGWLTTSEMMDGLGLAETTPGPLILVTEFIGFLTAFKQYGLAYGILAAVVTLWATFAPCFLWVFAGAPYIERLTHYPRLHSILSAITAAVVGGILNLSLWFTMNTLFEKVTIWETGFWRIYQPELASFDIKIMGLTVITGVIMLKFKRDILSTLAIMAPLGLLTYWVM
jgi:chromate transporter